MLLKIQKSIALCSVLGILLGLMMSCTPYGAGFKEDYSVEEYEELVTREYIDRVKGEGKNAAEKKVIEKRISEEKEQDDTEITNFWWYQALQKNLTERGEVHKANLTDLYFSALKHSSQVKVFADIPIIRRTGIQEALGEYDPIIFAEGGFNRVNEPVGDQLKTGNDGRFKENEYFFEFGVRKKFLTGAEASLSQRLRRVSNNSEFFDPNPQGVGELTLRVLQPLLYKAGIEYNESFVKLARIDSQISRGEFRRQMESHLLEVTRAYWALYLARANLLLRKQVLAEIQKIDQEMTVRGDIDALQSEIYHTRAALSFHRTRIIRAETGVRNAEDRLISLVNSPELTKSQIQEIIPHDIPITQWVNTDFQDSVLNALRNRPEIKQNLLQMQASKIRLKMSKNELLPILDATFEANISGLEASGDAYRAFNREFYDGDPGFKVGLRFEFPIYNRKARARHLRKKIEHRQLRNQFKTALESVLLEVKVSVREIRTTYEEFVARKERYIAAERELNSLRERRVLETILDQRQDTSNFLRILLQAQNVFVEAQFEFIRSLVDYNLSITNLKRAEGIFLSFYGAQFRETYDTNDVPIWSTRINSEDSWRDEGVEDMLPKMLNEYDDKALGKE